MAGQPTFVVFAGVNGAGKSTFYQSGLWRECDADSRILPYGSMGRSVGGLPKKRRFIRGSRELFSARIGGIESSAELGPVKCS